MSRLVLATVMATVLASQASGQRRPTTGTLEVLVALVGDELQVKPVPLMELRLTSVQDTARHTILRTALDGRASHVGLAGVYQLQSRRSATLGGRTYSWSLQVEIAAGSTTRIELTNANADSTVNVATPR